MGDACIDEGNGVAVDRERWRDIEYLLSRPGPLAGPDFEPCPEILEFIQSPDCRILCVGAGGLGCEILKDLALTGFVHVEVIDMDTIDVSNLNRQFLFRMADVGRSKAEVAAERINARVRGARVVPHHARIEDRDADWYRQFSLIVLGLDSVEARRHMNSVVCSFLEFPAGSSAPDLSSVKPVVDGGTEGFRGHVRVILPGVTPCFECTLWLFPPQTRFPLCTLAETPRSPAHCVEWSRLILWPQRRAEPFDADADEHLRWVHERAAERAAQFGIQGVTFQLTQGVVRHIVPAVAATNAVVSAQCVLEALKAISLCSKGLDNYLMYMGGTGVYTHTVSYEREPLCPVCGAGIEIHLPPTGTLAELIDKLKRHPQFSVEAKEKAKDLEEVDLGGSRSSPTAPGHPLQGGKLADQNKTPNINVGSGIFGGMTISSFSSPPARPPLSKLSHPSISSGSRFLRAHGIWEEETRSNLTRRMADLLRDEEGDFRIEIGRDISEPSGNLDSSAAAAASAVAVAAASDRYPCTFRLTLNDKKLPAPVRIRLYLDLAAPEDRQGVEPMTDYL